MSPSPPPHRVRRALAEVRAVHRLADAAWAPFSCPATSECCQLTRTGRPPWLHRAEWLLLEEALRAQGRALPPERADGGCPFLDGPGARCTVYADRPLGCRTFFCHRRQGAGRESPEELSRLGRRLEAATARLQDEDPEPLPLPGWIARARG